MRNNTLLDSVKTEISNKTKRSLFNNVIRADTLALELYDAFAALEVILEPHAGPFATNCVIGSKYRQANDVDEFTKDGIKILRHLIVSEDASERFAVRMVRFIGIAVDARCNDGTTTSMLLFCRLAKRAIDTMTYSLDNEERFRWWNDFIVVVEDCLNEIDRLKITEDDILERAHAFGISTSIEDVRSAIAFHMAMISSKGDSDLAEKIAKVIRSCPKKIFGMFRDIPSATETEEQYILKKQEFDLAINANIGNIQDYNYRNDSQWLSEDAVLFVTGNEIVSSSWESMFLKAFISDRPKERIDLEPTFGVKEGWETLHHNTRNLIIMTPMMNDPSLIETIIVFNKHNPHVRISWFNLQVPGRMRTSLNKTLHYMAGVPLFQDVMESNAASSLIGLTGPKIRAHLLGYVLALSNLYEKDGEVFHPLYRNPETFPDYTKFRLETEEMINFAKDNITNPALEQDELSYLTSLYRSLSCQDIYDIEIGGSIHDQYANRTVYEDAIGAALSAINEGVVFGGYGHLAKRMNALSPDSYDVSCVYQVFADSISSVITSSVRDSSNQYVDSLIENELHDKWDYLVADRELFLNQDSQRPYVMVKSLDKPTLEEFLRREDKTPILLQAWSGYHEQFRRFRDILPKLANTTNLADMRVREGDNVN